MSRPRPSLVRRLTVGFIIGLGIAIFLLIAAIRLLLVEPDESNVGPEVALAFLTNDLQRTENRRLTLELIQGSKGKELAAGRNSYKVISTRLLAGRTVIRALSDTDHGDGFESVAGGLKDAYFSALAHARRAA